MTAKAEDRRVQRTRKLLRDALIELTLEKGYDAVTVQDIIDRANVGRSTFYAHFLDKQQLLLSGIEQLHTFLAQQQAALSGPDATGERPLAFSLAMFQHAQSHHRLYQAHIGEQSGAIVHHHIQRILTDLVRDDLSARMPQNAPPPLPLDVVVLYTVSAFLGLLTGWLDQNMPYTAEEMDRTFRALVLPGIGAGLGLGSGVAGVSMECG